MFWIFKKKPQLKYVEWAKSNQGIQSIIILEIASTLKNARSKQYSFIESDVGIFEIIIMLFSFVRTNNMSEEDRELIDNLYTSFLELASLIFNTPEDKIYEIANGRGGKWFQCIKKEDFEWLNMLVSDYIYKWVNTGTIVPDVLPWVSNPFSSFIWAMFISTISVPLLKSLYQNIK